MMRIHWRNTAVGVGAGITMVVVVAVVGFFVALAPVSPKGTTAGQAGGAVSTTLQVAPGEGLHAVAVALAAQHLIRSRVALEVYGVLRGAEQKIKPGLYHVNATMSGEAIVAMLVKGAAAEATVTIPEGLNLFQIDTLLSKALVIKPGALVALQRSGVDGNLEGTLFPDTYHFYTNSSATSVVEEMRADFAVKAAPLLAAAGMATATPPANGSAELRTLTLASILEKEVPTQSDQEVVAGILLKRIHAGMPIDVDATVCYAKLLAENGAMTSTSSFAGTCSSLTPLDFKRKSPYNTYLYGGLPPGPIGNPGISAITAALHPQNSPYWYYLSDPKTGKTIFAKTLDEQNQNRVKYLESK